MTRSQKYENKEIQLCPNKFKKKKVFKSLNPSVYQSEDKKDSIIWTK